MDLSVIAFIKELKVAWGYFNPFIVVPSLLLAVIVNVWADQHNGKAGYMQYIVFAGFIFSFIYDFWKYADVEHAFLDGGEICVLSYFLIKLDIFNLLKRMFSRNRQNDGNGGGAK